MTLKELKELERKANDNSQPIEEQIFHEECFANALRRIGTELLALWEACEKVDAGEADDNAVWDAHDKLRDKARSMDA